MLKSNRNFFFPGIGFICFLFAILSAPFAHAADTINIHEAAVEVNGVKFWFPSQIFAKKGDKVKIHLDNHIPGKNNIHGFAIDTYKVEALVDSKGKEIEFVADKAGIFPIRCQLHPGHVGGQLVVLE